MKGRDSTFTLQNTHLKSTYFISYRGKWAQAFSSDCIVLVQILSLHQCPYWPTHTVLVQHTSWKSVSEFSPQNKALQLLVIHIIDSAKQIYNVVYIKVINSTAGIFQNFSHEKFVMFECFQALIANRIQDEFPRSNLFFYLFFFLNLKINY